MTTTQTISREWLQKVISEIEAICDEIPFGLGEEGDNTLAALKFALAAIDSKPVAVADVMARMRSIVADPRALPRRKEWISGQQYSYVLLENVEAMIEEALRATITGTVDNREIL